MQDSRVRKQAIWSCSCYRCCLSTAALTAEIKMQIRVEGQHQHQHPPRTPRLVPGAVWENTCIPNPCPSQCARKCKVNIHVACQEVIQHLCDMQDEQGTRSQTSRQDQNSPAGHRMDVEWRRITT